MTVTLPLWAVVLVALGVGYLVGRRGRAKCDSEHGCPRTAEIRKAEQETERARDGYATHLERCRLVETGPTSPECWNGDCHQCSDEGCRCDCHSQTEGAV